MAETIPPSDANSDYPRVVVADDRGLIRLGVVQLLRELEPRASITEVESCEDLLLAAKGSVPDLVIIGIELIDLVVPDCFEQLTTIAPNAAMVVLTEESSGPLIDLCVEAGVRWVLSTADPRDEVAGALRRILAGGGKDSPTRKTTTRPTHSSGSASALDVFSPGLSRRQMNLVRLLAAGRSNSEIGAMFGVSDAAVRADIAVILRIFGMGSLRASHLMRGE